MTYTETVQYLFTRLPLFQRTGPAAYKANLDNTLALDSHFGHPHRNFRSVHIAGTNGKGSVSHMTASVLQAAGYKTGLFTSPHLVDFRERIRINGEMITEDYVQGFVEENLGLIGEMQPSFFELTTLMAFRYFADSGVEIAVIETGLGGRLDSTNIITPLVSVITNIGLDHTQFLGDTLAMVAAEKAGIIKPGIPAVIGERQEECSAVFMDFAARNSSGVFFASDKYTAFLSENQVPGKQRMNIRSGTVSVFEEIPVDLLGNYQLKNVPTVLQSLDILINTGIEINENHIRDGLSKTSRSTGLRGRWEILGRNPLTVCDTGHNAEGMAELVRQIEKTGYKRLHFIFGMVSDKDPSRVLSILPKDALWYFTKADIPRALDPEQLKEQASFFGLRGKAYQEAGMAFEAARREAEPEDMIFIGGSTFVVAEVLSLFPDRNVQQK